MVLINWERAEKDTYIQNNQDHRGIDSDYLKFDKSSGCLTESNDKCKIPILFLKNKI